MPEASFDPLAEARGGIAAGRRTAWWAKSVVASHRRAGMAIARIRHHGELAGPSTDVTIEGFPRSANSFAVAAFRMPQGRPLEIAHHTHAAAQVLESVRRGLPTMVLVREPDDAVVATMQYRPFLTPHATFRGYARFHRAVLRVADGFIVAPFDDVIADFGAVMRRVNERFGTSFVPFEHTQDNAARVFGEMDDFWRSQVGEGEEFERRVGRPTSLRGERAGALAPLARAVGSARDDARRLYDALLARVG
jgi:hypothetical protein